MTSTVYAYLLNVNPMYDEGVCVTEVVNSV